MNINTNIIIIITTKKIIVHNITKKIKLEPAIIIIDFFSVCLIYIVQFFGSGFHELDLKLCFKCKFKGKSLMFVK